MFACVCIRSSHRWNACEIVFSAQFKTGMALAHFRRNASTIDAAATLFNIGITNGIANIPIGVIEAIAILLIVNALTEIGLRTESINLHE